MKNICILSTGQPSTNPRLVKEADALTEYGYKVTAVCTHWNEWADKYDKNLLKEKEWTCKYVGGSKRGNIISYWYTRIKHALFTRLYRYGIAGEMVKRHSLSRTTCELEKAAMKVNADLFIAHNLGALPAAANVAKKTDAKLGFDAEDCYTGMDTTIGSSSIMEKLAEYYENKYACYCDYITTPSDLISKYYAEKYGVPHPITIYNVFPKSYRPEKQNKSEDNGILSLYWFSQTVGENRGIEDIVVAMGKLNDLNIELNLRGKLQNNYDKILYKLAEQNNLEPCKIKFLKPESPENMIKLSSLYDIGLALEYKKTLNRNITITNKIFSYLLAGNAILATNTLGQESIANELGDAVKCYNPGNIDQLTDCLNYWYKNRNSLNEARRAAWDLGENSYNWDIEKEKLISEVSKLF